MFDQHPDSLVRVVQVCYKKKRILVSYFKETEEGSTATLALSDKIYPYPTKYCCRRTLAIFKTGKKTGTSKLAQRLLGLLLVLAHISAPVPLANADWTGQMLKTTILKEAEYL